MLVEQRIAVIGGASGIGFEVARQAADRGAEVILGGSRPERLAVALGRLTGKAGAITVDVRDEASVARFFAEAGEVDHVVATVGAALVPGPVSESDSAHAAGLWQVKYWGQLLVAKYGAPRLSAGGSVTLTSGILGQRPAKGFGIPASVNAAVEALARTLALEIAPGRVNVVCPGFIDSGKLYPDLAPEEREAKLFAEKAAGLPVQTVGHPAHAAAAYLYAMQNPYVTGQTLVVDGGAWLL